MKYSHIEVTGKELDWLFCDLPRQLFGNDPYFVAVPNQIQQALFDVSKNKRLQHLRLKRWLLQKEGRFIGRIAAFDHPKPAMDEKSGAIGFFDCIADDKAAQMLLDIAEKQLLQWEVDYVDGPIQPGENDQFWGLLVEGFGRPSFGANWNPPYYSRFLEEAGYVPYYDQITNVIRIKTGLPERFFKIAAWVKQKDKVELSHFSYQSKAFYAQSVAHIYNHAWHQFENFTPKQSKEVLEELERLKHVIKEDLIWFAHIEKEAAAFMLMVPDMNQHFAHINGNLNFFGKLKLWWYLKTHATTRLKIIVMGVIEKYQKLGLESVLIDAAYRRVKENYPHVNEVELAWVGDFNAPMLALHQAAGAKPLRRHVTYRKSLNDDLVVKKFEIKTD